MWAIRESCARGEAIKKVRRCGSEPTLYIKCQSTSEILILELYVDDLIVTGSSLYFIFQARYDEQLSDERFGVDE